MSANGRFISEAIFGQQQGHAIVRARQTLAADPDAIYKEVTEALEQGDASRARLQGFCRAIQKSLEQQIEAASNV